MKEKKFYNGRLQFLICWDLLHVFLHCNKLVIFTIGSCEALHTGTSPDLSMATLVTRGYHSQPVHMMPSGNNFQQLLVSKQDIKRMRTKVFIDYYGFLQKYFGFSNICTLFYKFLSSHNKNMLDIYCSGSHYGTLTNQSWTHDK